MPWGVTHAGDVTYQYDDAGRLKKITYPDYATRDYTLDPAGNRTQVQALVPTGGVLAFTVQSYSISESAGTVQLSIGRTGSTTGAVALSYATADGTAVSGSDYIAASGTLNWAAGDAATKTITLTILNDTTPEATEQFVVNLSNPSGGAVVGAISQATVIITDDDKATISITNQSVSEGAGTMSFTVTLSPASGLSYQVNYASANGTAMAGSDYTAVSSVLTFAANQTAQTIIVPIANDSIYKGNRTFTIMLSSPTNGALLGAATATGTIIEDDAVPSFAINDVSVNENAGSVTFTVTKSGNSALMHAVTFATTNGTATAGSDYTPVSGTLSFLSSDTSKTITISILDDTAYEGDETFAINLNGATNGAVISRATGTGRIIEDDPVPPRGVLGFNVTTASVAEGVGNVTLTVVRFGGSYGAASVVCYTADGSATASSDYTAIATTLTWADGDSVDKSCTIPIINDTTPEGTETFSVNLRSAVGAALGTPAGITVAVTIADDDAAIAIPNAPLWTGQWASCTATCTTYSTIVTWASGGGTVSYYELQEIDASSTSFSIIYSGTATSFDDFLLTIPGESVQYRVRACNGSGCSPYSPTIGVFVPNIDPGNG